MPLTPAEPAISAGDCLELPMACRRCSGACRDAAGECVGPLRDLAALGRRARCDVSLLPRHFDPSRRCVGWPCIGVVGMLQRAPDKRRARAWGLGAATASFRAMACDPASSGGGLRILPFCCMAMRRARGGGGWNLLWIAAGARNARHCRRPRGAQIEHARLLSLHTWPQIAMHIATGVDSLWPLLKRPCSTDARSGWRAPTVGCVMAIAKCGSRCSIPRVALTNPRANRLARLERGSNIPARQRNARVRHAHSVPLQCAWRDNGSATPR